MTREELGKMIGELAGAEVARAMKSVNDRLDAVGRNATPLAVQERLLARGVETAAVTGDVATLGYMALGIHAMRDSKGDRVKAVEHVKGWAISQKHQGDIALREFIAKALTAGDLTEGGAFFSPEHSQEIIDLLAPQTVVRKRIKASIDVTMGQVDMARLTADAAVSWGGEVDQITESQPTTDQLVMRPFKEKVLVPFSNTFLRRGGPAVANFIQRSTMRALSIGEDIAFLLSPGSENRPKGLLYWAPLANRIAAQTLAHDGSNADLIKVTQDLGKLLVALEQANVKMTNPAWVMSPRTKNYLFTVRNSFGAFAFNEEMKGGTLWGIPFDVTTSVPNTLGAGSDSLLFLTDYDEFLLGQGAKIQVDMTDQGTIVDVDGNVISLFQRDMSGLRIINEVDLKPQHAEATAHLTGVEWYA